MTLISCAECGKSISDLSNQCIGCGAPIIVEVKTSDNQINDSNSQHKNLSDNFFKKIIDDNVDSVESKLNIQKERHIALSIFIYFSIFLNLIICFIHLNFIVQNNPMFLKYPTQYFLIPALSIASVFFSYSILKWKKIGFWGILIVSLLSFCINYSLEEISFSASLVALLSIICYYGLMKLNVYGLNAWDHIYLELNELREAKLLNKTNFVFTNNLGYYVSLITSFLATLTLDGFSIENTTFFAGGILGLSLMYLLISSIFYFFIRKDFENIYAVISLFFNLGLIIKFLLNLNF